MTSSLGTRTEVDELPFSSKAQALASRVPASRSNNARLGAARPLLQACLTCHVERKRDTGDRWFLKTNAGGQGAGPAQHGPGMFGQPGSAVGSTGRREARKDDGGTSYSLSRMSMVAGASFAEKIW